MNDDSGNHVGKRRVWGGRKIVRCGLYMATLFAVRFNPVIRAFYERLLNAGKQKGRPHRLHAQALAYPQRHGAYRPALESSTSWPHRLTFNTVALPASGARGCSPSPAKAGEETSSTAADAPGR